MKKYLYLIKNSKIPTYLKYWLMYSSKKISLLMQSLPITLENTIKDLKIVINKIYGNTIQDGEPTPENQVPIENITEDVEVKVQNKNLCNGINQDYYLNMDISICGKLTGNNGLVIRVDGTSDYTVSTKATQTRFRVACLNSLPLLKVNVTAYNGVNRDGTSNSITINTNGYKYLIVNVTDLSSIQIEKGSTATPYTPHKEQTLPLTLGNIELCKIGDYQDSIVKDNGKWYLNKQIGKVVLDGSENWVLNSSSGDSYRYWLKSVAFTDIFTNIISGGEAELVGKLLCNYFTQKIFEQTYIGAFSINVGTGNNKWFLLNVSETSLETFKAWLNEHNTKVYYTLATATNTEITDTTLINQLNALEQAYSYEEVTNISSNQNIYLDIDYIKRGVIK